MTQKFYAIVTNLGAAKIANAAALGTKLNITQMAVGDGGGTLPTPNASQTKLVNEVRRAAINTLSIDPANASQVIAEQVIPETEGGFWIREMGLFDADGTLIAVCNTPETYKPALQEGSGRTQTVRMLIIVNSTDAITLKIDPSVVLATRKYVDDNILTVRQYADQLLADHVAAANPHNQYPLIKNALKEMADAGLLPDVLKNLGLGEAAKRGVAAAAADMIAGGVNLPTVDAVMSLFRKRSFAANDYIRIPDVPGGLIIQWGIISMSNGAGQATFPIAFPAALIRVWAGDSNTASWSSSNFTVFGPTNFSLTGVGIRAVTLNGTTFTQGTTGSQWLAIGF
ncbi:MULTISPECIES: phage tail protein [Pantoea]|uniref:phage tail protein n=1 Tax=Pantoea TaxID=53335 RepID=UPI002892F61C|nr:MULTISPECIES: phage tail protein [Pantoea]